MDLSNVKIRPFLPKEWPDFKAKRLEALAENANLFLSTYEDAAAKPDDFWRNMLTNDKECIFGLYDGTKLIGLTGVFENWRDESRKTAHMGMSFIDANYRKLGLSRLLYQERIDWTRAKGYEKITVGHREGNEASKAANQKFGFVFYEKEEIDFPDGTAFDYRYELRLI